MSASHLQAAGQIVLTAQGADNNGAPVSCDMYWQVEQPHIAEVTPLERGMAVVRGVNRGSTRLIVQSEGVETALLIFVEPVGEFRLEVNEEGRMEWQWTLGEVGDGVRRELQKLGWWSARAGAFISSTRSHPRPSCLFFVEVYQMVVTGYRPIIASAVIMGRSSICACTTSKRSNGSRWWGARE